MVRRFDAFLSTPYALRVMLDPLLRRYALPLLAEPAARLAKAGVSPLALKVVGFVIGTAALPAIGRRAYLIGLVLIAVSGLFDTLVTAMTEREPLRPFGRYLGLVLDLIWTASVPFAFALGEPDRGLAAMFLMLGLVARTGATAAEFKVVEGSADAALGVGESLVGKTEVFLAYALACVFVDWFSIIAYVLGMLCFVMTGFRVARAGLQSK